MEILSINFFTVTLNTDLAPTYQRLFGTYWVLWYPKSNNYSIVESEFKKLLDDYIQSNSFNEFADKIELIDNVSNPITIAENLSNYLQHCNKTIETTVELSPKFKASQQKISSQYIIKGKRIEINYDTDVVKKTIHPSIAHLEVKQKSEEDVKVVFDIYLDNDLLCLFRDQQLITSVPKHNYHLLQGKFIMQLLSIIHDKEESEWIGTFHGSTMSDGYNSILFVGESGKGKSTLCTLLANNGFEMLADDVSPMLFENSHIYHNPSAVSIKEGAFDTLQSVVNNFNQLPITIFNKTKGPLKYIPCKTPTKDNYPCKAIIMVNYMPGSKTILEKTSIKNILETLIPDSWLSLNPIHAKQFLDWLQTTHMYQLTYSDTSSVIAELTTTFNKLK